MNLYTAYFVLTGTDPLGLSIIGLNDHMVHDDRDAEQRRADSARHREDSNWRAARSERDARRSEQAQTDKTRREGAKLQDRIADTAGWRNVEEAIPSNKDAVVMAVTMVVEPLDYAVTAYDVATDPFNPANPVAIAGALAPFASGRVAREGFELAFDANRIGQNASDTKVIGRKWDTDIAIGWEGHDVLNLPDSQWSIEVNDRWVQEGIEAKQDFYTASPLSGNLWDDVADRKTVYGREFTQIEGAGHIKNGDTYVHPNK